MWGESNFRLGLPILLREVLRGKPNVYRAKYKYGGKKRLGLCSGRSGQRESLLDIQRRGRKKFHFERRWDRRTGGQGRSYALIRKSILGGSMADKEDIYSGERERINGKFRNEILPN